MKTIVEEISTQSLKPIFAIQDTNINCIQWIGAADDETNAIIKMNHELYLFDPSIDADLLKPENWLITELSRREYDQLDNFSGTDQEAINLLQSFK